jgi:hypothetical protein
VLAAMRISTWWPVPFDRVFALALDTKLDVGDRKLRAIRPPPSTTPCPPASSTRRPARSSRHLVDVDRFDAVLEGVRRLAPSRILSSHLPAAGGSIDEFLTIVRSLRDCEPFEPPDQAQFEQMLAMMAPPPAAATLP